MAILALSPWRATVLKTRQYPPLRSPYRSGAASKREWTSCLSYIHAKAWRLACKSPRFPSSTMWSTCFRTARARTRVVLMRPCRIVSVVSARRSAFLWSAGLPSFLNPLRCEIILSWVLETALSLMQTGCPPNDPVGAVCWQTTKRSGNERKQRKEKLVSHSARQAESLIQFAHKASTGSTQPRGTPLVWRTESRSSDKEQQKRDNFHHGFIVCVCDYI